MQFRNFALFALIPIALPGQTPALTINSASVNIDPTSTDSYNLQGAFTGLDFSTAQSVTLQVGPFSATIPIGSFVQQPANVFTYRDSSGQVPYWVSTLTIDNDAGAFTAQANGVVLAGIGNPFAVQIGTDQASTCSMVRLQASQAGVYQLTPGDGFNEPCLIAEAPDAEPPAVFAGTSTNVTFTMSLLPTLGLDPTSLQVYAADGNGQPNGGSLCTLTASSDGETYSCTATFNQAQTGMIPLVVQANAGSQTILSPGFVVQVVPATDADNEQISDIQDAMLQTSQNFTQYGDGAYSRILTMQELRALLQPEPGLLGQPVELCPDGLSIGIRSNSGLVIVFLLNDLTDLTGGPQAGSQSPSAALAPRFHPPVFRMASRNNSVTKPKIIAPANTPLQFGQFQRDIVDNDQVLLWDPGKTFWGAFDYGPTIPLSLTNSQCPRFNVIPVSGPQAGKDSLSKFSQYGTIILNTHGGVDPNNRGFMMTGDLVPLVISPVYSATAPTGISCVLYGSIQLFSDWGCFVHVYASLVAKAMAKSTNTMIFASMCFSAHSDMAQAFAPLGSNNGYFGFTGTSYGNENAVDGALLFGSLVHQHTNAHDAFLAVPKQILSTPLIEFGDKNLAYLGNPTLFSPQQGDLSSYVLGPGGSVNLQAQLDGASSCGGVMNYNWTNTGYYGHLTPEDNFTSTDSMTTYTANPNSTGIDAVTVGFYPSLSDDSAAMACTAGDVTTQQILHVVFNGTGTFDEIISYSGDEYTANLTWRASWDLPLYATGVGAGVGSFEPALPGTVLTGVTTVNAPDKNDFCTGPPVVNPTHDGIATALPQSPYLGVGPYPFGSTNVAMWVETFGGDDYNICGGGGIAGDGDYGEPAPGYPGWDTPAEIIMFNLDVSQWFNQPDHSMSMPVNFSISPIPGGYDTGKGTQVTGTLTFTSRTVPMPNSSSSFRIPDRSPVEQH